MMEVGLDAKFAFALRHNQQIEEAAGELTFLAIENDTLRINETLCRLIIDVV